MSPNEQNVRGVKRRRSDDDEDQETRLRRKLHHDIKEVRKTVKKAKTFEVQKTLKKLKDARRKDSESAVTKDLETQVDLLKHLNYDQVANSALLTKLRKDKILYKDPSVQAISTELASNSIVLASPRTPMAQVQSRILSSKVLASEVASIMEALRNSLHPAVRSEDEVVDDGSHASSPVLKKRRTDPNVRKHGPPPEEDSTDSSGEGTSEEGEDQDDDGGEDDDEAADDGWESGTISELSTPSASPTRPGEGSAFNDDDSGDEVSNQDDSDDRVIPPKRRTGNKIQPLLSNGQSEFLPSLSVGFTRGDSESEFSDSEAKVADGVRKNRRGQRARRAIWEKKFGKNANHVKKQQEVMRGPKRGSSSVDRRSERGISSNRSHDAPFGSQQPTRGSERNQKQQNRGQGPGTADGPRQRTQPVGGNSQKRDALPLHPSWEAKKKQKSASIVPSQGTKIVFS